MMNLTQKMSRQGRFKRFAALFFAANILTFAGSQSTQDAIAQGGTRSLTIQHAHTKEQETITYKRFGSYDAAGLKQINWILRDWRRDEPTRMDPILLDILWEVYRASGSSSAIHVVSGYRSPGTNAMLARRSRGVARNSQHMSGKAIDFNIPDVSTSKLRDLALRLQNGGVGYYPNANNPWVHIDTGGVRHWPKVSRDHLVRLFPDEKTVHIPNDGKPLAGFEAARSIIEARGGAVSSGYLEIASGRATGKTLFQILFGGGDNEEEDIVPKGAKGRAAVAARQRANQRVASAPAAAPDVGDASSAIAFFNQNNSSTSVASRVETPAAQASIRTSRPTRPTPIPEPRVEEKPVETKAPEAPAPQKEEAPKAVAVAALSPSAQAEAARAAKAAADAEKGRWVTVALPQRRPANLVPKEPVIEGPTLVTVTLPPKRPADLDSLIANAEKTNPAETQKPIQVASAGKSVTIALPSARPANLPSAENVGLRTGSAPQVAASNPPPSTPSTALGFAPSQPMQRIIPASPAAANPVQAGSKDKKSLDALISQVAIASSPTQTAPVAPISISSVSNRSGVAGKFEAKETKKSEGAGFSGSAIRPISSGFKTAQ